MQRREEKQRFSPAVNALSIFCVSALRLEKLTTAVILMAFTGRPLKQTQRQGLGEL